MFLERTGKRLLNIHHLPRRSLHESTPATPRPLQPMPCTHPPLTLEIAFIPRHDLDWHGLYQFSLRFAQDPIIALQQTRIFLDAVLGLNVDHLHIVGQGVEGGRVGEVVDEKKGVGGEVGTGPEGAVFFLAGRVGQGEVVGEAVYGAGYGVGVLNCGVVSVRTGGMWLEYECGVALWGGGR